MIVIDQQRFNRRDRFIVKMLDDAGNLAGEPRIVDPIVSSVVEGDNIYFLLRSTEGVSDDRFYHYMNVKKLSSPIKTRTLTATALRRFQCFLEIYRLRPDALTDDSWTMLEHFVLGKNFVPMGFRCNLLERSVQTANYYLTAIQRFLRAEGIHYPFLEEPTEATRTLNVNGVQLRYTFTRDVRTLKGRPPGSDYVPKYVSPGQFKALMEIVTTFGDKTAIILLKLMYFYGLRLGECLGLTQEDIVLNNDVPGAHGAVPMLRLRNRPSDSDCQRAKRLPTMTCDTNMELGPMTYVLLTRPFFAELQAYVQETFEDLVVRHPDRLKAAEATILTPDFDQDANHYIFFNTYGRPLMDAAWNVRLKRYFKAAGIHVDKDRKKSNLSHQLRHGCAMLLYRYLPEGLRLTDEQLRRYLRHRRVESSYVYSKPTVYDEYCFLVGLQDDMARELPFINTGYEVLYAPYESNEDAVAVEETYDNLDDLE